MSNYRELLIGCGHARDKRLWPPGANGSPQWQNLHLLDSNRDVYGNVTDTQCPFYLGNLDYASWSIVDWYAEAPPQYGTDQENCAARKCISQESDFIWRFNADAFDEIHAYEVIEHLGVQGDAPAFFAFFSEAWRILKPGGHLCATVPSRYSEWLWGDPSHRRAILPASLVFLDQTQYIKQLDGPRKTSMSDFRSIYRADFKTVFMNDNRETFRFILQAIKPARSAL